MFALLLGARLRMLRNVVRESSTGHKIATGIFTACAMILFIAIGVCCAALLLMAQSGHEVRGALSSSASALVNRTYEYLFFFLLAGSVPFVASTLFQADDFPLLLTSPIRPRTIVAAKILDATLVNAAQFLALGVPVLLGMGWAVRLSAGGWIWLVIAILLLLILPPAATSALLLAAAKLLGMRRVRMAVMLISIGLGVGITMLAVIGTNRATRSGFVDMSRVEAVLMGRYAGGADTALQFEDTTPQWIPSGWAAAIMRDTAGGRPIGPAGLKGFALLLVGTVSLLTLSLTLGEQVFRSEAFLENADFANIARPDSHILSRGLRFLRPGILAVLLKDLKYIARDLILLGQIGTALILFLVPFALRLSAGGQKADNDSDMYAALTLGMLLLIVYMVTSIVSLSSVGLEGKGAWLVLGAPVSRGDMLRAKWLVSFLLSLAIADSLTLFAWAAFQWSELTTVLALSSFTGVAFALSGLGVGLSGLFPRFLYENPAHRASISAIILGFVLSTSYLIFCALIAGLAYLAVQRGIAGTPVSEAVGTLCFVALSAVTGILPFVLAERRLQDYSWEH